MEIVSISDFHSGCNMHSLVGNEALRHSVLAPAVLHRKSGSFCLDILKRTSNLQEYIIMEVHTLMKQIWEIEAALGIAVLLPLCFHLPLFVRVCVLIVLWLFPCSVTVTALFLCCNITAECHNRAKRKRIFAVTLKDTLGIHPGTVQFTYSAIISIFFL